MQIVILDSATTDMGDQSFWAPFEELGTLEVHARTQPSETVERLKNAEALLTNKVVIGPDELAALPALKYIGVLATGYNVVDIPACRQAGVAVTNIPGYSTESVAQLVFAMLLNRCSLVESHHRAVQAGRWEACPDFSFTVGPMAELAGKVMAIVGSGAIGLAVARIALAFGMEVIKCQVPGSSSLDRVPLEQALPRADVVTLHCPLTSETAKLVDEGFIAKMKPDAILINTGRGGLIDEAALIAALRSGRLGAVCLDVLSAEPPPAGHPLLGADKPWADRLVVTPHIAWATLEARQRLIAEALANLKAYVSGERRNRVDPESK